MESLKIKEECIEQRKCVQTEVPLHLLDYIPFSSNGTKLQNVCRLCLNTILETKVSLLSVHSNIMLIDILRSFTSVQISVVYPDNDLPSYICERCHSDVINCYEFKLKCEHSDSVLQSLQKEKEICKDEDIEAYSTEKIEVEVNGGCIKEELQEELSMQIIEEEYLEDLNELSGVNDALLLQEMERISNRDSVTLTEIDSKTLLEKSVVAQNKAVGKYTCNFCSKKFNKVRTLRDHVTKRHSSEEHSHPCDRCKEVFNSQYDLKVHSSVHTAGPLWQCNTCDKSFKVRAQLRRHVQRHMRAKRFTCDSCGKSFSELCALRRHVRVHTGEIAEKNYACHLCEKRYSLKSLLEAHIAAHSGERRCVCATCGKAFASARLLASHRLVHSDLKPYACSYCDKRFRHESTRNTHHRTHTGEKPYVCAKCGKTFIQNSNLTLHMRTHTGEKPYACDKCDRKFSSGSSLKNHTRRHTGEKPYSCPICGKRFARRDVSGHMRAHTGEKPHACSACPKAFASASRLRDHCRMHTGEKPFECATCTQKFTTKANLVKHLRKHEPNKKRDKRKLVLLQHVNTAPVFLDNRYVIAEDKQIQKVEEKSDNKDDVTEETKNNITLELTPEVPLEVSSELVVQDNCDVKEILVVDNSQNDGNYQGGNICINTDGVNYVNSDVNLVTVNEGTTVKLYQLDQSLVQIHTSGGQVTISKITSKMTANF